MNRILVTTAALALLVVAGPALAGNRCNVPAAEWQPIEALRQKLEGVGWKVRTTRIEDGCYEVYAHDDKGRRVEAYFDPKTFEAVKTKVED